jgi:uncharacterized protein
MSAWLGLAYERGLGVSSNETEAARWYQLAAKQGDPIGQYFLALSLAQGHGIPKDPSKAIELPQHSAEQGYLPAQLDLALGLETA